MSIVLYGESEKSANEIVDSLKLQEDEIQPVNITNDESYKEFLKDKESYRIFPEGIKNLIILDPLQVLAKINEDKIKIDPKVKIIDIWNEDELNNVFNNMANENQKNLKIDFDGEPLVIKRHTIVYSMGTSEKEIIEKGIKPFYEGNSLSYIMYIMPNNLTNTINKKFLDDAVYLLKERFPRLDNLIGIKKSLMIFDFLNKNLTNAQSVVIDKLVDMHTKESAIKIDPSGLDPRQFKSRMAEIEEYIEELEASVTILDNARFIDFLSIFLTPASTTRSLKDDLISMMEMTAARLDAVSGFWLSKFGKKFLKNIIENMQNNLSKAKIKEIKRDYKKKLKEYKEEVRENPSIKNQILLEGFLELAIFFESFGDVLNKQNDLITNVKLNENISNILGSLQEVFSKVDSKLSSTQTSEILKNSPTYRMIFSPVKTKWDGMRNKLNPILSVWENNQKSSKTGLKGDIEQDQNTLNSVNEVLSFLIRNNEEIKNYIFTEGTMANVLKEFIGSTEIFSGVQNRKINMKEIKNLSKSLTDKIIKMLRDTIGKINEQSDSKAVSAKFAEAWEYVKNSIKSGGTSIKRERKTHKLVFAILTVAIAVALLIIILNYAHRF